MACHPAHPDYHLRHGALVFYDPMTAVMVGLQVAGAVVGARAQTSEAKAKAKATIAEGNIAASNKAKEVMRKAATQRVSFLNSGLTLEGTPMNVIESTFTTGLEDIERIGTNANTMAKNQISAGRSAAISSLASTFSGMSMSGIGDTLGTAGTVASGWASTGIAPQQWPAPVVQVAHGP